MQIIGHYLDTTVLEASSQVFFLSFFCSKVSLKGNVRFRKRTLVLHFTTYSNNDHHSLKALVLAIV